MKTTDTKDQKTEQYIKLPYLSKVVKYLLILYIFLLPIQTRYIYPAPFRQNNIPDCDSAINADTIGKNSLTKNGIASSAILPERCGVYHHGILNGGEWEYGTKSLYATEILLLIIILLYVVGAARWLIRSVSRQSLPKGTLAKTAKKNLKNPLISLPIALLLWSAFSILWSYDETLAWYRWTILLEGVVVYFFVQGFNFCEGSIVPIFEEPACAGRRKNGAGCPAGWLGVEPHMPH